MLSFGGRMWRTGTMSARLVGATASREVSNEPMQKTSEKVSPSPNIHKQEPVSRPHVVEERIEVVKPSSIVPQESSLVERRDYASENVDPFDDVPGPAILRRISSMWQYLPEIGCQATVSAMISFFKIAKFGGGLVGLRGAERPFSRLFRKYGPIVKLQGPLGAHIVLICRPEHIAKVYEQEGKYPIRSTLDSVEKCRSATRKPSSGPYNLSGIEWEEMRRAIEDPLMRSGEKSFEMINDAAVKFVGRIQSVTNRQNEVGDGFILEINKWSLECMCVTALDKSLGLLQSDGHSTEATRLLQSVLDATDALCKCERGFQLWRFVSTPAWWMLSQSCNIIEAILSKHVRYAQVSLSRRKEEGTLTNKAKLPLVEALLVNECLTPDEVITCLLDILLIGVNTTSSALAFLLYHLAQNHRAQRSLFKEVKEALPGKSSQLSHLQLSAMPYLDACLKESLRLKMPMPIMTRVLAADIVLSNFRIPKGTYMVMDAQAACLKETDFEKADRFVPERWLDAGNVRPFAFIPFGHGVRSCVGRHLAETQIKACAARVVRQFQIEYNYGEVDAVEDVVALPNRPLKLSFIEREE